MILKEKNYMEVPKDYKGITRVKNTSEIQEEFRNAYIMLAPNNHYTGEPGHSVYIHAYKTLQDLKEDNPFASGRCCDEIYLYIPNVNTKNNYW